MRKAVTFAGACGAEVTSGTPVPCWRKHAFIQWSMSLVASGSGLILIARMVK
jgi:hypothetical protein